MSTNFLIRKIAKCMQSIQFSSQRHLFHLPPASTHAQHPDKCPDDPEATARFQALSIIHATLSDEDKRRSYDETGEVESEEAELKQSEQEWYDYWRVLFPTVTVDKIKKFQGEYQGSEEEKGDVLKAYEEGQGKMSEVIDNVILATDDDEGRFREIIEAAIAAKEVKRLKGFKADVQKDAKRKERAEKVCLVAGLNNRRVRRRKGLMRRLKERCGLWSYHELSLRLLPFLLDRLAWQRPSYSIFFLSRCQFILLSLRSTLPDFLQPTGGQGS